MKKAGAVLTVVLMLGVLGGLVVLLLNPDLFASREEEKVELPTAQVTKRTITTNVTGPAEVKGAVTEKLKMAKWQYYGAFVAPFDQRIAAGTPIVEYANGQALVAPYDLVIRSKNLPEKKWTELTEEHYVEVSRVDLLHVELDVHELDIGRLSEGQPAQITLAAGENRIMQGAVVKINQIGTYNATGSKFRVTIEVVNDGSALLGMSADVCITVGEAVDVLTVPVSALEDSPEGTFVSVQRLDGSITRVQVETGLSDGTVVEVRGDLSEGDTVLLHEGERASSSASSSPLSSTSTSSQAA